jgi:uncharacterized membrane protein YhaH (DUF805 family)
MSNPYGWSPPINGQPAVYFAPPGQTVQPAGPGTPYVSAGPSFIAPETAYYAAPGAQYPTPETSSYAAPLEPYDNGYDAYRSYRDQHAPPPVLHDPFAALPRDSNPFLSLPARGARPKVTMVEAIILWLRNWNNFSGRASRSEYWWIRVVQFVGQAIWWVLLFLVLQMRDLSATDQMMNLVVTIALVAASGVALVVWVPTLSLTVRRLHDTDHSGWFFLLRYIPFVSWLLVNALRRDSNPDGYRFDDHTRRPFSIEDIA